MNHTYEHNFGKGVTAKVSAPEVAPEGEPHLREVEWTGNLGPWLIRPYVAWINEVNMHLAHLWNKKLMHVFLLDLKLKKKETWVYEPGQPPKMVKRT